MKTKKEVAVLSRSFGDASTEPQKLLETNGFSVRIEKNEYPQDPEIVAKLIGNADAAIVGSDVINKDVLDACNSLKLISKHGVGLDNVDLEYAEEKGVGVRIAINSNSESVADFAVMLMLSTLRELNRYMMRDGDIRWSEKGLALDLFSKTVGIIGYGKIGRAVARRLTGFRCRVLVYDPMIDKNEAAKTGAEAVSMEELLKKSDVVSLHAPLTESTRNLIGKKELDLMKESAVLINTSRGPLVDEVALYAALTGGKLHGFGTDVFGKEPPIGNPLVDLPNVLATPHVATHTMESNYRMGMAAAKNIVDYFDEK